jgi:uncharacterized FAD-dependent dehydrogenase
VYDVTIIGAGVAGVFLAYTLADKNQKVLLIDKGKPLLDRACPRDLGQACTCDACDTYYGFAGLGKSEGKFNYSSGFGGELARKTGTENFQRLMHEVDDILCRFGGDKREKYSTENPLLAQKAKQAGLQMISTEVRHLGSSLSIAVFQQLYLYLQQQQVDMQFETDVFSIRYEHGYFQLCTDKGNIHSKKVVIATGRSGADWLAEILQSLGIKQAETRIDLGIRVEMKAEQLRSILQDTCETKLALHEGNQLAMTYCMNPNGRIVHKYQEGLVMPDGQNFREKTGEGSQNVNFTLFVPRYFSTQKAANEYAFEIIKGINQGEDRIVVQRWGDLRLGKSTTYQQMQGNQVKPTLTAEAGNVSGEIPSVYIRMLQTFFARLERLIEQSIHPDTLLYGIDAKFYAPMMDLDASMQTIIPGLYVIGDCSGVTHSLSQAAASGIYVGKRLASCSYAV